MRKQPATLWLEVRPFRGASTCQIRLLALPEYPGTLSTTALFLSLQHYRYAPSISLLKHRRIILSSGTGKFIGAFRRNKNSDLESQKTVWPYVCTVVESDKLQH
jgi:hypothetical protein